MVGKQIKSLREARGLTQRALAKQLGMAPSTLAMYEIGKREPDNDTLKKFADFFGVSTDYLLGRTDDPTPPDVDEPTEQELEELMKKEGLLFDGEYLDKEDREDLLAVMRIAWKTIKKRKQK